MSSMRVAGAQVMNAVGDIDGNRRQILEAMDWAEGEGADVLVLPELALTGYPLADLVLRREFVRAAGEALRDLARRSGRTTTVVGTIDRVPPRRSWDTRERSVAIGAAVLCDGEIRGVYHKVLLPTYEVFEEARNFAAGTEPAAVWRIGEVVAGVCICEDLWPGDGPPEAQAAAGAQILLVPNASPFHREKPEGRRALAASVARRNGVPVVYVNCVGGQDELVFDGGSLVVDADGEVRHRAPQLEESRFCLDLPVAAPRPLARQPRTVHARPSTRGPAGPPPPSAPQLDQAAQVWGALVLGTGDFARANGMDAAVLGLSGGIDAAVTAAVAAEALGAARVLGLFMPSPLSPAQEALDAEELAKSLGIGFHTLPVGPPMSAIGGELAPLLEGRPTGETRADLLARVRGAMLYAVADELGHLALATGNKSELSIGSAALYGDMAGDFAPLKDCAKTLLYELARWRNRDEVVIPRTIVEKVSTAQESDQVALPPYEVLDPIVELYVERAQGLEEIVATGLDETVVRGVLQMVDDAEFKRRQLPPGVKITTGAFGQDLRMPISNRWRPYRREEAEISGAEVVAERAGRGQ